MHPAISNLLEKNNKAMWWLQVSTLIEAARLAGTAEGIPATPSGALWALPSSSLLKGLPLPSRTRLSLLCPPRITPCPGPEQLGASQRVLREMIDISQEDVSAIQYLTLPSLRLQKGLPLLSGKGLSLCRPF